jgi:hypothetical protein
LINVDFNQCPYQILTSMGGLEKAWRLIEQKIVFQINPNKLTYCTIVRAQIVVMHVMSYGVLVRGVVLYPLGVTIDFWEETTYYRLG